MLAGGPRTNDLGQDGTRIPCLKEPGADCEPRRKESPGPHWVRCRGNKVSQGSLYCDSAHSRPHSAAYCPAIPGTSHSTRAFSPLCLSAATV